MLGDEELAVPVAPAGFISEEWAHRPNELDKGIDMSPCARQTG